mgnify:CR=1 FL=1
MFIFISNNCTAIRNCEQRQRSNHQIEFKAIFINPWKVRKRYTNMLVGLNVHNTHDCSNTLSIFFSRLITEKKNKKKTQKE